MNVVRAVHPVVSPLQQYSQFVLEVARKFSVNPADVTEILQSDAPLYPYEIEVHQVLSCQMEQHQFSNILKQQNFYESPQSAMLREQVIRWLDSQIKVWSKRIADKVKRINPAQLHKYTAQLLQFGSSILGLNSNESDLDFVCVVPNFIDRKNHFYETLKERIESNPSVSNLKLISEATVPILTFDYKDIPIDISYAQIDSENLPLDIQTNISQELIASIKEKQSVTAILGRKNNQMILQAVSKVQQVQNFRVALRLLKIWAKKKGIYNNAMGFIGGITLAIMVAKICQLFPRYRLQQLMREFFYMYSCWDWKTPVMLAQYKQNIQHRHADMRWRKEARQFSMAVLTPAFPQINTTSRINKTTLKVIQKEMYQAVSMLPNIRSQGWQCLYKEVPFFQQYPFIAVIDVLGRQDRKQFIEWFRFIESKLIVLIAQFDRLDSQNKVEIMPFTKSFERRVGVNAQYQHCRSFFVGFKTDSHTIQKIDIFSCVRKFVLDIKRNARFQASTKRKNNVRIYSAYREQLLQQKDIIWKSTQVEKIDFKRQATQMLPPKDTRKLKPGLSSMI